MVNYDQEQCLKGIHPSSNDVVTVDCVILHGAVIVNMLKPNRVVTFQEYAAIEFLLILSGNNFLVPHASTLFGMSMLTHLLDPKDQ